MLTPEGAYTGAFYRATAKAVGVADSSSTKAEDVRLQRLNLVLPAGIEPTSPASETGALSIVLQEPDSGCFAPKTSQQSARAILAVQRFITRSGRKKHSIPRRLAKT